MIVLYWSYLTSFLKIPSIILKHSFEDIIHFFLKKNIINFIFKFFKKQFLFYF